MTGQKIPQYGKTCFFQNYGKIPMPYSVPNHGNWLNLLTPFLKLNNFNIIVAFLNGYYIHNYQKKIWPQLEQTNDSVTVIFKNIDVRKTWKIYKSAEKYNDQKHHKYIGLHSWGIHWQQYNVNWPIYDCKKYHRKEITPSIFWSIGCQIKDCHP